MDKTKIVNPISARTFLEPIKVAMKPPLMVKYNKAEMIRIRSLL